METRLKLISYQCKSVDDIETIIHFFRRYGLKHLFPTLNDIEQGNAITFSTSEFKHRRIYLEESVRRDYYCIYSGLRRSLIGGVNDRVFFTNIEELTRFLFHEHVNLKDKSWLKVEMF